MRETVQFYFDPLCPWAWQGAKWIREVERVREIDVEWRLFSLFLVNEHSDEFDNDVRLDMTFPLRTLALIRRERGNEAVERAYAAFGERTHERREKLTSDVARAVLADAGLDAAFVDRAIADESTAEEVAAEHREVVERVGAFGVPTIVLPERQGDLRSGRRRRADGERGRRALGPRPLARRHGRVLRAEAEPRPPARRCGRLRKPRGGRRRRCVRLRTARKRTAPSARS